MANVVEGSERVRQGGGGGGVSSVVFV